MEFIKIKERKDEYYIWETAIFQRNVQAVSTVLVELINNNTRLTINSDKFIVAEKTPYDKIRIYTLPIINEDEFKICFLESLYKIRETIIADLKNEYYLSYNLTSSYIHDNSLCNLCEAIRILFDSYVTNNLLFICSNKVEEYLIKAAINKTFLQGILQNTKIEIFNKNNIDLSICNHVLNNSQYGNLLNIGFAYGLDEYILEKVVSPFEISCYGSTNNNAIGSIIDDEKQSIYKLITTSSDFPISPRSETIVDHVGYYLASMVENMNISSEEDYDFICSKVVLLPYNYYNIESLNNEEIEDLKTYFLPQFKQAIFEAFIQLPKFKK